MAPNFTTQTEGSFELEIGSNEPLSVRRRLSCRHLQQPFECKITRLVFLNILSSREKKSVWMMKSNRYVDILARTCQRRRTKVIGIVGPYVATFCWDLLFLSAPTTRHRKKSMAIRRVLSSRGQKNWRRKKTRSVIISTEKYQEGIEKRFFFFLESHEARRKKINSSEWVCV